MELFSQRFLLIKTLEKFKKNVKNAFFYFKIKNVKNVFYIYAFRYFGSFPQTIDKSGSKFQAGKAVRKYA